MEPTPNIELKLPVSGTTVLFRPFLTTGQSRELQKILLKNGTFNTEAGKLDNVTADTFMEMQDKAAEYLIVGIKNNPSGNIISFTKEMLDELPVADGNMVYDKVNKLTQSSNLSPDDQKK